MATKKSTDILKDTGSMLTNVLCYVASFFLPSILLIVAYNRNRIGNLLIFGHVLILTCILAVIGVLIFVIIKKITQSAEGALLVSVAFWLFFWMYSRIFTIVTTIIPRFPEILLTLLLLLIVITIIILLRRFKPPFVAIRPVFNVLTVCIIGMFIINLIPAVSHEVSLYNARVKISNMDADMRPYRIKSEFNINPQLDKPNIYWFHVDGMMSIETFEWFSNGDFNRLRKEIDNRGFIRLEDAELNAGFTYASLTAMLSPGFYDSYFGEILNKYGNELKKVKGVAIYDEMTEAGLTFYEDIAPYYEMLQAFAATGYDVSVYNMDIHMPWELSEDAEMTQSVIKRLKSLYNNFTTSSLPQLLSMTTPLTFREKDGINIERTYDEIMPVLDSEGVPSFLFIGLNETHMSNVWRFDKALNGYDPTAVHAYPLAYRDLAENLLYLVDTIQTQDPNAVIVVQADHGFHIESTQEFLLSQGYSEEQVLELMYSVFSAVYIPEKYGGLDAPLHPLNISRELVNRFVGENYELIVG